ncbi:unnamed protein product [Eretmochelys imbricata]
MPVRRGSVCRAQRPVSAAESGPGCLFRLLPGAELESEESPRLGEERAGSAPFLVEKSVTCRSWVHHRKCSMIYICWTLDWQNKSFTMQVQFFKILSDLNFECCLFFCEERGLITAVYVEIDPSPHILV